MSIEFERRFLVDPNVWAELRPFFSGRYHFIRQGYVCGDENAVVRLRGVNFMPYSEPTFTHWYMTTKMDAGEVGKNHEFEFMVDGSTGPAELYEMLKCTLEKNRFNTRLIHLTVEVDEFLGRHSDLVIAEVELESQEDSDFLTKYKPAWFGEEITGKKEYSNYALSRR